MDQDNNMCDDEQIEYRLGQVEKKVNTIDGDIKEIMRNHLPHIEKEMVGLKVRMTIFGGFIITGVGALIIMFINS